MKRVSVLVLLTFVVACGGGGGSDSGPCSIVPNMQRFIAGGEACSGGSPSVALIITFDKNQNWLEQCTGAYVSLTSVLTAAHCFSPQVGAVLVASHGNLRNGTQYFINPAYNGTIGSSFDMAVLRVDKALDGAPLPVLFSSMPVVGDQVAVFGYGLNTNGKDALTRIQNGEIALDATYTTYAGYLSGTNVIVSTGAGSTCQGDSGGPALAKNANGDYGIFGITRAGPLGCDADAGRPSYLSSTQSVGAVQFLQQVVPDLDKN